MGAGTGATSWTGAGRDVLGRGAARGAVKAGGVSAGRVDRCGSPRAMAGAAAAPGRVPRSSLPAPRAEEDRIGVPLGTEAALGEATAVVPRTAAFAGTGL